MTDQLTLDGYDRASAALSLDGRYRWALRREWGDGPLLGWIMLNPSTADARVDDPTVRRCVSFARRDGYGGIVVANLFGLRSTDPADLDRADDPVGRVIVHYDYKWSRYNPWDYLRSVKVVAAWGSRGGRYPDRVAEVLRAGRGRQALLCLGTTKGGEPRHPLYVRGDQPLVTW